MADDQSESQGPIDEQREGQGDQQSGEQGEQPQQPDQPREEEREMPNED